MPEINRVLVLPDLHFPFEDKRAWRAVLAYARDHKWDAVVLLGDIMDHDSISHWNKDNVRAIQNQLLAGDYAYGNQRLDELEEATPGADKVAIEGNHDHRPEVYVNKVPQLAGMIETDVCLRLSQRNWKYARFWSKGELLRIGNAYFAHGRVTSKYHAEKMANDYGVPIFTGHTHDRQYISKVLHGKDKTIAGESLGCLCRSDMPYLKGRPTKWQLAFSVFYFFPDGYFNHYVVDIFKNRFVSPEGKVYVG